MHAALFFPFRSKYSYKNNRQQWFGDPFSSSNDTSNLTSKEIKDNTNISSKDNLKAF